MVHLAIGLLIILVLIPLALKVEQAPPPTIAEFAPQVRQQVKEPPRDQAANVGQLGGSGGGAGQLGALPSPTPPTGAAVGASPTPPNRRFHRCVGNPPRQIEDPQSPPCVPYWEGNNGGPTAKGVTGSTITVVFIKNVAYRQTSNQSGDPRIVSDLVSFFNDRFEFYGRKIVVQYYDQASGPAGPEAQVTQEDQQFQPFAHWSNNPSDGSSVYSNDAFARHRIITTSGQFADIPAQSQQHMAEQAPYQWMYIPSYDQVERNLGEVWCKEFKDRPPRWAGSDVTTAFNVRHLQVYVESQANPDNPSAGTTRLDTQPLVAALGGCGATARISTAPGGDPQKWQAEAVQARQNGITTVACLCQQPIEQTYAFGGFTSQGYHPEWINTDVTSLDLDSFAQSGAGQAPSDQYPYVLGLGSYNKSLGLPDMPWWWAVKEVDPTYAYSDIEVWNWGYWALLLIASGIQQAGPHLTPQTFEQGLQQTRFPNPGADGPPYYQARVGFGPGNHSMIDTFAPIWFDPNAASYAYNTEGGQQSTGAFCYVNRGVRFALGEWPTGEPAFRQPPCR